MIECMIVINCVLFFGADFDDLSDRGAAPAIYIFSVISFAVIWICSETNVVDLKSFLLLFFSPMLVNLPIWFVEFVGEQFSFAQVEPIQKNKVSKASSTRYGQWKAIDSSMMDVKERLDLKMAKAEEFLTRPSWFLTKYLAQRKLKKLKLLEKEMRLLLGKQNYLLQNNIFSFDPYEKVFDFNEEARKSRKTLKQMMQDLATFEKSFIARINNADLYYAHQAYQHKGDNIWADYDLVQEETFWQEYEALLVDMKAAIDPNIMSAS